MDLEQMLRLLSKELIDAWLKCASAENRELLIQMSDLLKRVADRIATKGTT